VVLSIYLPVAGSSVSLLVLVAIGAFVGALSGFFGVGAGFLLAPLLITVGIPPTVAAASSANQSVAASSAGAFAHVRTNTFDRRMVLALLLGGLAGGTLGVRIIRALDVAGHADLAVRLLYVALLGILGLQLLRTSLYDLRGGSTAHRLAMRRILKPRVIRLIDALPGKTAFPQSDVRHSVLAPIVVGFAAGLVGALTGVGGGFLLVPAAASLLRMPFHLAVGTVLVLVCLSSANVTLQHAVVNGSVDVVLAMVVFVASLAGVRLGQAVNQRWLRAHQLRILLAMIVLFATVKLVLDLVLPPETRVVVTGVETMP
jgi:uncharacterized membrane protein YfcA